MAVPFLELTKLQKQILFEFVRQQGYAEGVHKLYQRLSRDIGSMQHPAMNKDDNVAKSKDEVLEFIDDDLPNVANNKYLYKGIEYTYETRAVTKQGVVAIERRKLLPSRRGIEDFFRKDEIVQIDKQSREANAGGQRTAPGAKRSFFVAGAGAGAGEASAWNLIRLGFTSSSISPASYVT